MKKYILILAAMCMLMLSACQKDTIEVPFTTVTFEELANRRFVYGENNYVEQTPFGLIDIKCDEWITFYAYDHRVGHLTFDPICNTPGCNYTEWDVIDGKVIIDTDSAYIGVREVYYDGSCSPARLYVRRPTEKEFVTFIEDLTFDSNRLKSDYWFPWNINDENSPWEILFEDE